MYRPEGRKVLTDPGGRWDGQGGGVTRQEIGLGHFGAPRVTGAQSSELTVRGEAASADKMGSSALQWARSPY